jgi:hypothetical protein
VADPHLAVLLFGCRSRCTSLGPPSVCSVGTWQCNYTPKATLDQPIERAFVFAHAPFGTVKKEADCETIDPALASVLAPVFVRNFLWRKGRSTICRTIAHVQLLLRATTDL